MINNFIFYNPTKIYFGDEVKANLSLELANYGKNVVLVYGCGSVVKNGIFDEVNEVLKKLDKNIAYIENPNPTLKKLEDGVKIARAFKADFILALGGGSVILTA